MAKASPIEGCINQSLAYDQSYELISFNFCAMFISNYACLPKLLVKLLNMY